MMDSLAEIVHFMSEIVRKEIKVVLFDEEPTCPIGYTMHALRSKPSNTVVEKASISGTKGVGGNITTE